MSYNKNTWQTGDVVTAQKLNHLEDGVANAGSLTVHIIYDQQTGNTTLDKTWQEINDALMSGTMVFLFYIIEGESVGVHLATEVAHNSHVGYLLVAIYWDMDDLISELYKCESSTDYPVLEVS